MRFKVYLLRRRGRRRPWREVRNGASFIGDLRTYSIDHHGGRYTVATLAPIDAPIQQPQIADLYEPVLLGFAPLAFRLRGFERLASEDGDYTVLQEWHCELP